MSAPKFIYVQGVADWSSGAVTEFSTTNGSGDVLASVAGALNYSSNVGPTGPQFDNTWSALYPVYVGTNSYEFVFGLYVSSAADNSLSNLRVWVTPFTAVSGCTFYMGTDLASGFSVPLSTTSLKATTDFAFINDPDLAYLSVVAPDNIVGGLSSPIWTQVASVAGATGGNQTGMPVIGLSIDWA